MTFEPIELEPSWNDEQAAPIEHRSSVASSWRTVAVGIALTLAAVTFLQQYALSMRVSELESQLSGTRLFQAPADLEALISKVQMSVVVIECKDMLGSGWVVDLGDLGSDASAADQQLSKTFPTEVITNHHVIKDCINTPEDVRATAHGNTYEARLYSWDEQNDLALVSIKQVVPALRVAKEPRPGQWVMALGAPYGLEDSVSIGNVINVAESGVISTAALNNGNSGGPLVTSTGRVVGTNAWILGGKDKPQDWNISIGIPSMCTTIVACEADDRWTWGWKMPAVE